MAPPAIVVVDDVGSTMDAAHRMAADGAPHGTAVRALRQTGARGQHGRSWSAGPGGLWISVVGRPVEVEAFPTIALRVGLVLAEAIELYLPPGVQIGTKWPNDLLIERRKVGGILTEARWSGSRCLWVVAGIGLNVTNAVPPDLANRAVALSAFAPELTAQQIMEPVRNAAANVMSSAPLLTEVELERWSARDTLRGMRTTAPVVGRVIGIDRDGALLIEDPGGLRHACRRGVATTTD